MARLPSWRACASGLTRLCLDEARSLWRSGTTFVYPPGCPLCGTAFDREPGAGPPFPRLCADCEKAVAPETPEMCLRCGAPVGPHLDTTAGCIHCGRERFAFETVVSLQAYTGELRRACLRSKQPGGEPLCAALAELLWRRHAAKLQQMRCDCVLPVPRHWMRDFAASNNAEPLARSLARRLKVPMSAHILAKVRRTPAQTSLTPSERRSNLRSAFRVRKAAELAGATVLVVDDVLTTGTTANEISKVVRRAGAERVVVAVLARGLGQ